MHYRLVIFDFDGTLADTANWFFEAWNRTARRFGMRVVSVSEMESLRGCGHREILSFLEVPLWKLPAVAFSMRKLAAVARDQIRLFPGVDAMLARLSATGALLALVSSNSEATVLHVLGPGNAGLLETCECGASLFGKANRLAKVLRRLGIRPEEAIYVGDEARDVEAALSLGMAAAAVLWGYASAEAFVPWAPLTTFSCVTELSDHLVAMTEIVAQREPCG